MLRRGGPQNPGIRPLNQAIHLFNMTAVKCDEDRAFVREVLVKGADTHARDIGNSICGEGLRTFALQYFRDGVEDGLDRFPRAALLGTTAGRGMGLGFHAEHRNCRM